MKNKIKRGDLFFADLDPTIGSEQGGFRPVLIVQNDKGNTHSPTTQIVPLSAQTQKKRLPTHVRISRTCGLDYDSLALCEQLRTIDKSRFDGFVGRISSSEQATVNQALAVSLALGGVA